MRSIRVPPLLVPLVLLAALPGCGGASRPTSADRHQSQIAIFDDTPQIHGDGPVTTVIMIDRTPLLDGDPKVANGYVQAGLRFATPTITRGGHLVVQAFGRVSGHPVTLLSSTLPTLAQAGPAARDDAGQMRLLERVLRVGVGLDPPPSTTVASYLADLTSSAGSDISRAVVAGIAEAAASPVTQRNVLIETDGWAFEADRLSLARILANHPPSVAAASLAQAAGAALPASARASLLRMVGLGYTSGRPDPTPTKLDALVATWRGVCATLPVASCDVASDF